MVNPLLPSKRATPDYTGFAILPGDILLPGREPAGVPHAVRAVADAAIRIPMQPGPRSRDMAVAAAMVAGEALRQLRINEGD